MPDRIFTMDLKAELAERIETLAAKLKIKPEYLCYFFVVDSVWMMEGLEKVSSKSMGLRDQLRDLVELRSLNALSDDEFLRELTELAASGDDDEWNDEA